MAQVVDQHETFVHTHFLTDLQKLREDDGKKILADLKEELERFRIVVGAHFEKDAEDPGIRVVLECRPAKDEMAAIRARLERTLAELPRRPAVTTNVRTGPYR